MKKVKVRFIINPISGGKSKAKVEQLILSCLDLAKFDADIRFTNGPGHAVILAQEGINDFEIIVAVGGDGTINEIAGVLKDTSTALAIVPYGSGNGLARFLKIPLKTTAAIKLINGFHKQLIDTAVLNGKPFFNLAGIGLDANVSYAFSQNKKRGFLTYVKMSISMFMNYKPATYTLEIDGQVLQRKALTIGIANSSQYGNDLHIAPNASITDGLLDVCIIKPVPLYMLPRFVYRLFFSKTEDKTLIQVIKGSAIKIELPLPAFAHLDGEPLQLTGPAVIAVYPLSLYVIVPA